jgi:hypothetical protein
VKSAHWLVITIMMEPWSVHMSDLHSPHCCSLGVTQDVDPRAFVIDGAELFMRFPSLLLSHTEFQAAGYSRSLPTLPTVKVMKRGPTRSKTKAWSYTQKTGAACCDSAHLTLFLSSNDIVDSSTAACTAVLLLLHFLYCCCGCYLGPAKQQGTRILAPPRCIARKFF